MLFVALVPALCLLSHICFSAIPEWWQTLAEKAARDEERDARARLFAQQHLLADQLKQDGINVDDLDLEAPAEDTQKESRMNGTDGVHKMDGDGSMGESQATPPTRATRPTRPTRPAGVMPNPAALPAPAWFVKCLPRQLQPQAVQARAQSFWKRPGQKTTSERIWLCIQELFTSCCCCMFCSSIMGRLCMRARAGGRR